MSLPLITLALNGVALPVALALHRKHPDHGFASIAVFPVVGALLVGIGAWVPVGVVFWIGFGISACSWTLMVFKTYRPVLRILTGGRLGVTNKRKAALAALDNHARRYGMTIPTRIRAFYTSEFERYHHRYVKAELEAWGGANTFQLALTPPTWLNKDDDAVNGPRGEWTDAKHHVPLFVTDQALYVVANLQDARCPVGWYHEETYQQGPSAAAASLDEFLAMLTQTPETADPKVVCRPADMEEDTDWNEDFSDDGPRVFDAVHGEE